MSNKSKKAIGFFEKYLTLWVVLCMAAGTIIGQQFGDSIAIISRWEIAKVNIPVAILVWLMIYPMMVQIDFDSLLKFKSNYKGLIITVVVNWLIKPLTMAFFAYIFFYKVYQAYITPEEANSYLAGAILLGAAPCTAMVFVWSYLSDGDANYTLVQVSINDLILLVAFIPIVGWLFSAFDISFGTQHGVELGIPYDTLSISVATFVVIPLITGYITHKLLIRKKGAEWFKGQFLPRLKAWSIIALLSTLILLFAFQGEKLISQPESVLMIGIPLIIQTYFIFFATWFAGKFLRLRYAICAPSSMIGASNFFELAVAVAISIFGLESGASLTTVVGVLIEVPVMLSLVWIAKRWKY